MIFQGLLKFAASFRAALGAGHFSFCKSGSACEVTAVERKAQGRFGIRNPMDYMREAIFRHQVKPCSDIRKG